MKLSVPYQRSNISIFYNKISLILLEKYLSWLMSFWYLLHIQAAKTLASLHRADLPEPSLLAKIK